MYSGQCLCGNIKINILKEPLAAALFHCLDCRRGSGSVFGLSWVVHEKDVVVTGQPKQYSKEANSGNKVASHFCGDCGTTFWRDGPATEGMMYVKVGVLDDQDAVGSIKPSAEMFTKRRFEWLTAIDGAMQKSEMF